MTKLFEMAIEAARQLSPEEQDDLAQMIMDIVGGGNADVYVLSDEERTAIDIARAQVARGEFASEQEIEEIFTKYAS